MGLRHATDGEGDSVWVWVRVWMGMGTDGYTGMGTGRVAIILIGLVMSIM